MTEELALSDAWDKGAATWFQRGLPFLPEVRKEAESP